MYPNLIHNKVSFELAIITPKFVNILYLLLFRYLSDNLIVLLVKRQNTVVAHTQQYIHIYTFSIICNHDSFLPLVININHFTYFFRILQVKNYLKWIGILD